ncbi:YicC/YloC family endoribonuclease [Beijerinckia indica]|uniref:YicC domain protein n=1 Tax=Beijerinckia indica subsp. indica (strain ATCC 9039 / DSM 1715 / NCIMB 8712) TaxID=395963 RepID=B2IJR0_BEII9|nr:YicC/YloC family endoribonuclease [Beijerinckia indica]ACB94932.1 protein of unknown function DUF1732 [Beijerinckia indica subsp. indica ATCC 9039]
MSLASMTGFARCTGSQGATHFAWELKSVNAKGLDLRLRLPQGFDAIETEIRQRLGKALTRGTVHATLTAQRESTTPQVHINQDLLHKLLESVADLPLPPAIRTASLDGLLGVRGLIEIIEVEESPAEREQLQAHILARLDAALSDLLTMRQAEGAALAPILLVRLDRIAMLTEAAEQCPGRQPEAIKAKLSESLVRLAGQPGLDPNRLHQEALLMAAKADIREELDRLLTHVKAARGHLESGGPIGRKLDFLAQEFGREANTLCSKSNDARLTDIGLELRVEIEQFREQIQNLE